MIEVAYYIIPNIGAANPLSTLLIFTIMYIEPIRALCTYIVLYIYIPIYTVSPPSRTKIITPVIRIYPSSL